jgi:hypothetical protein
MADFGIICVAPSDAATREFASFIYTHMDPVYMPTLRSEKKKKMSATFWLGIFAGSDRLEDSLFDRMIILKWT